MKTHFIIYLLLYCLCQRDVNAQNTSIRASIDSFFAELNQLKQKLFVFTLKTPSIKQLNAIQNSQIV